MQSLHMGCNRAPELYNLADDPAQEKNVASAHPDKLTELHNALLELLAREAAPEGSVEVARSLPGLEG